MSLEPILINEDRDWNLMLIENTLIFPEEDRGGCDETLFEQRGGALFLASSNRFSGSKVYRRDKRKRTYTDRRKELTGDAERLKKKKNVKARGISVIRENGKTRYLVCWSDRSLLSESRTSSKGRKKLKNGSGHTWLSPGTVLTFLNTYYFIILI